MPRAAEVDQSMRPAFPSFPRGEAGVGSNSRCDGNELA